MTDFLINNWVSITGAIIGLLYLYFEYKANIWMWPTGIVMSAFYIYIFYANHLYAMMVIYIYFLLASIYGFVMWATKYKKKADGNYTISHMNKRFAMPVAVACMLISFLLYHILVRFGVYMPFITVGDALTTSLNFVALWMVSRKWVEQWLLVIPANALSSVLLFMQNDSISGILFAIYFVVSIFGYYKWRRMVN